MERKGAHQRGLISNIVYTTKVVLGLISSIERDENCTKEQITHTNFKVLNWIRIKEDDVSNKL